MATAPLHNAKRPVNTCSTLVVLSVHRCFLFIMLLIVGARLATMIPFLLLLVILPLVMCDPLQLDLLSTSNTSWTASHNASTLNATRLTTDNDCFDDILGKIFPLTKSDCEHALDTLVKGKSLLEPHYFGYQSRGVTDRLPLKAEYGTCSITFMMFDLDKRIALTYAEIYAELLGPDGVLKECLGPSVPAEDALGGQTVLGPRNLLIVDVEGRPYNAEDQKSR
ncbi:hypothetical protein HO173_005428 [Letharia columbiana]|uniref:Uncharacterized protein n=1 Tax=Letharia columbiana TaxID=112416 RepID=A0A8H6L5H3_9LECA|nr:uncharacterized protein HO173_005428 [Letharia columbiana]KAF6236337.1 hypothetical protein HO173_005428 [Letharia columbiana]